MMVYGIVWILCDVSLVQLHFLEASTALKFCVLAALVLVSVVTQVLVLKGNPLKSFIFTTFITLLAVWQTADLPSTQDSPQSGDPHNDQGYWVGKWQGLPGQASALFQPYAYIGDKQLTSEVTVPDCSGKPTPYRLWVRGVKARHLDEGRVLPGLCVWVRLQVDDEAGEPLPAGIESWRQRQRIVAGMRVAKDSEIRVLAPATDTVEMLRLAVRENFQQATELDSDHRLSFLSKTSVLLGLVSGDRALMKPSHWKVFADTGTSHLMAISGSHVSMFAVFVYALVRRLVSLSTRISTLIPAQHVALLAGWLGALAYALLADFNVPTQRTLVMIGVAVILKMRGRSLLDWRAWWIALVAVTVYDPLAILDRGAWLSFFAVALILWVLQGRVRTPGVIKGWLLVQLAIFLGLAPLLAFAFGGFPWISPVANAIAIPVTGFLVVPGALLSAALWQLSPTVATPVLHGVITVTDALLWFLQQMAGWGGAGYRVPVLPSDIGGAFVTLLGLLGVMWCLAPRGVPGKSVACVLLVPVLMGPGFYGRTSTSSASYPASAAKLPALQVKTHWLPSAQRQSFLIEDEDSIWWVFEAGQSSKFRQKQWESWARETGLGYAWDFRQERYADWVKSGFIVHHYQKTRPLPGQVHLQSPRMQLPCVDTTPVSLTQGITVTPITDGEGACWLQLKTDADNMLLAGDLRRDTQLRLAVLKSAAVDSLLVPTLLVTPRSGQRLMGATLNRYEPAQVVQWPGKTKLPATSLAKLKARAIKTLEFPQLLAQKIESQKIEAQPMGGDTRAHPVP